VGDQREADGGSLSPSLPPSSRRIPASASKNQGPEKGDLVPQERWAINVKQMEADSALLPGDVLLAAAFVSYVGYAFNLHTTHYTLHTTHYTLHTTPYTLHPAPYTLHPAPYTLNP